MRSTRSRSLWPTADGLHFPILEALAVLGIMCASTGAQAETITLKCKAYNTITEETGTITVVIDKSSKLLQLSDDRMDDDEEAEEANPMTIDGDIVKSDFGGFAVEVDLASGKGQTFLLQEPYDKLFCREK